MSSLILKKIFFISVALLASAVPFEQAQAAEPDRFPEGQEVPLPGPVQTGEVTLWLLPEDYRSVIKTEEGDVYGIYYSAWNRQDEDSLPGVYGGGWIEKDNKYQPWKGNPDLAKELSEKYFGEKKGLMISCTGDNALGKNCVAGENGEVKNLKLHSFWNGGGFAYAKAEGGDGLDYILRPHGSGNFQNATAYYWNGILYRTANYRDYKIQFFAGCKLDNIISSGRDVATSLLSSVEDCSKGVAPVFDGGTLKVAGAGELDSNFVLFDAEGNTIDSQGNSIKFTGDFTGPGGMIFKGEGTTVLSGENTYEGLTAVENGTLQITSINGLGSADAGTRVEKNAFLKISVSGQKSDPGTGGINDARIREKITLAGGELNLDGNYIDLRGGVVLEGEGVNSTIRVKDGSTEVFSRSGEVVGEGGLIKEGAGYLRLATDLKYEGETIIEEGELRIASNTTLPQTTDVTVKQGGTLRLIGEGNEVQSLTGDGLIILQHDNVVLTSGLSDNNDEFSGVISGLGGFAKVGKGATIFSGANTYRGDTTIQEGGLIAMHLGAIPKESVTTISGTGYLDLAQFAGGGFVIDDITIEDKGRMSVAAKNPLKVSQFAMNGGEIDAYVFEKDSDAPIQVQKDGAFAYTKGTLNVLADSSEKDPEGVWNIIDAKVTNEKELAANTVLKVGDEEYPFEGIGEGNAVEGASAVYQGYLQEGSLELVIEVKEEAEIIEDLNSGEEVVGEIIDGLLDGLENEDIDLPLGFDYVQLARLVDSGLAPRNVDAAGRGLALHNNLLVDALFEREPLRQFEELVAEESVVEEEAVIEEAAPVQPLWLKAEELSDEEATAYVEGAVEGVEVADADLNGEGAVAIEAEEEDVVVEFDGVSLIDLQDDELDLAKREGVSAWVKGFGGNSRADDSSILYNDYDLNAYGTSFGVDVALSESFQIGAYGNYGDLNVNQRSGDTGGGSWNPDGWGGGLTAQYSTRHFYVQGLLGASEFSGEQSRNILRINEDLGGNTARGDKSVTSYLGALRIGAPFKTGGVVLEPQGQVVWTRNHEQGFSETSGTEKNLRLKYKSRTTNFAETELGMKLSVPIRTGERGLLVPSVRAAWLADWNQANEGQEIGYKFTKKTANFDSQLGTENGALIEAGLDYTVQNFNGISVKLYGRGGMEFWASDRGTTWRASGGVTFQF